MKLKLSLKSLVRAGLLLEGALACLLIFGCSSSTNSTYLKKDIESSIENLCKEEYKVDVKAHLVGRTLWIYIPFEDIITAPKKPEKYTERYSIKQNAARYLMGAMEFQYLIEEVPEQEKQQQSAYDKKVSEKVNNVWKVLRRVLFSLEKHQENPEIFCVITADIKKGFYVQDMFYFQDLKRVSYSFISWDEFHHRTVQDMEVAFQLIGDKEGAKFTYRDIPFSEFIAAQIKHRIQLKFEKPEVGKHVDIDKEIIKIISYTLRIYRFADFKYVEMFNMQNQNRIILNRSAAIVGPNEQRF